MTLTLQYRLNGDAIELPEDEIEAMHRDNRADASSHGHDMVPMYLMAGYCDCQDPTTDPRFAAVIAEPVALRGYHPDMADYEEAFDAYFDVHVGGVCVESQSGLACQGCFEAELDEGDMSMSDSWSCQRGPDRIRAMLDEGLWYYASTDFQKEKP